MVVGSMSASFRAGTITVTAGKSPTGSVQLLASRICRKLCRCVGANATHAQNAATAAKKMRQTIIPAL